jgi:glycosyltransferase involved in cell wall biosynthesis
MKLLIVADGRSPITLNWIRYFTDKDHTVFLVSTYPCSAKDLNIDVSIIPVAYSQITSRKIQSSHDPFSDMPSLFQNIPIKKITTPKIRTVLRQWLSFITIPVAARQLRQEINQFEPDLVHAMRIPYEGMLATNANPHCPLLISVWGNDFTLHAVSNPWMRYQTRKVIHRADALHTDCWRDLHLAHNWGFSYDKPSMVLPSGGGVRRDIFYPPRIVNDKIDGERNDDNSSIVINPRGFRAYVRNDIFFKAIPLVLEKVPDVHFICPGMLGEHQAVRWITELKIANFVTLLPIQEQMQMGELFRSAQVTVSPTIHDGTPNSLLESLACGCFPVAGDLESIREWITSGINGLLVNPNSVQDLADAIIRGITQTEFRNRAAEINARLISEKADHLRVMEKAENFYYGIIKDQKGKSL